MVPTWVREYEAGLHTGLNGERIYATDRDLHYLGENPIRIEPNGILTHKLVGVGHPVPFSADREFRLFDAALGEAQERQKVPTKNGDDAIMDFYLSHHGIAGQKRREAELMATNLARLI